MKRALVLIAVPGVATFAAWRLTLGSTEPDYSVALVAILVLALLGIGIATGWWAHGVGEGLLGCASTVSGISTGCYVDWSDDTTGLFMVGWSMVTIGAFGAAFVVITGTVAIHAAHQRPSGAAV